MAALQLFELYYLVFLEAVPSQLSRGHYALYAIHICSGKRPSHLAGRDNFHPLPNHTQMLANSLSMQCSGSSSAVNKCKYSVCNQSGNLKLEINVIWTLLLSLRPIKQGSKNRQIHKKQNNLRRLFESLEYMHRMLSHTTTCALVQRVFKRWGRWIRFHFWNSEINIPGIYGSRNEFRIRW